jgi:uncharacterized protein RhaS with RHS repeats
VLGFSYSNQDWLLAVTDPRKLTTKYIVDGLGQQTSIISPDTGTNISQFDGAGNPDYSVDAADRKTAYRFDAARRLPGSAPARWSTARTATAPMAV